MKEQLRKQKSRITALEQQELLRSGQMLQLESTVTSLKQQLAVRVPACLGMRVILLVLQLRDDNNAERA
jgi:hypothetical protein